MYQQPHGLLGIVLTILFDRQYYRNPGWPNSVDATLPLKGTQMSIAPDMPFDILISISHFAGDRSFNCQPQLPNCH